MAKDSTEYKQLEIDAGNKRVCGRLLDRFGSICNDDWWESGAKIAIQTAAGKVSDTIDYFERIILADLFVHGIAKNDEIIEQTEVLAREMGIPVDAVVSRYNIAWNKVEKLMQS
jgi:hypothetical protein